MGKLFYLMGKSSSGKDTIYAHLLRDPKLALRRVIPWTTRPMRTGEHEGTEYHFTDEKGLNALRSEGKVIEERSYHTVYGIWTYFTADDGDLDLAAGDYLAIGTLESYAKIRAYFGTERVVPLYIEVEDGLRLERALERERAQKMPQYEELCRRFLADQQDFADEQLAGAGIEKRFYNNGTLEACLMEIRAYMEDLM